MRTCRICSKALISWLSRWSCYGTSCQLHRRTLLAWNRTCTPSGIISHAWEHERVQLLPGTCRRYCKWPAGGPSGSAISACVTVLLCRLAVKICAPVMSASCTDWITSKAPVRMSCPRWQRNHYSPIFQKSSAAISFPVFVPCSSSAPGYCFFDTTDLANEDWPVLEQFRLSCRMLHSCVHCLLMTTCQHNDVALLDHFVH